MAAGNPLRSVFTRAMSVIGSVPTTRPVERRPSANATSTVLAPAITWSSVTMVPSADQLMPLPRPLSVRMVTTDGSTRRTMSGMAENPVLCWDAAPVAVVGDETGDLAALAVQAPNNTARLAVTIRDGARSVHESERIVALPGRT